MTYSHVGYNVFFKTYAVVHSYNCMYSNVKQIVVIGQIKLIAI